MPSVPNLEFSADEMRRMADAVMARSIEHVASLGAQPVLGDVNARAFCRALREPAPEAGCALEPLLDQLFDDCIPRSFNAPAPGYLAFIPGGGVFPAALADFITNTTNRYTGRLAGGARAGAARGQRARLAARLDGIPRDHARAVHRRRLDGDVQRHAVRSRAVPRRRHPPRRALHVRPGASLGAEGGEDRRRHARPRARAAVRRALSPAGVSAGGGHRRRSPGGSASVCGGVERRHDEHRRGRSAAGHRRPVCRRRALASRGRRLRRVLQSVRRGTSGPRGPGPRGLAHARPAQGDVPALRHRRAAGPRRRRAPRRARGDGGLPAGDAASRRLLRSEPARPGPVARVSLGCACG